MTRFAPLFIGALIALNTATAQTRTGSDYAVFFYVTDFQPGIDDIPYTKGEAEELAEVLTKDYGFSCHFVRECKKEDITVALEEWNKKIQPNDQALFFFSMHGYYDQGSDRGFLIPADGKANAQHDYFKTWLSYDDLRTYLAPCKAGHILVALDACYSGSFGIRSNKKMPTGEFSAIAPDCRTRINNVLQMKGRQFITSGKMTEETPKRSAFAAEITAILKKGYNIEGFIFYDDLVYQLHKLKNPEPEDGIFVNHKPGGDFVFIHKNSCFKQLDQDGDLIPDQLDKCPEIYSATPDGCPPLLQKNDSLVLDIEVWKQTTLSNQLESYELYLRKFPHGQFVEVAHLRLEKLKLLSQAERDWKDALTQNKLDVYMAYSKKWPNYHTSELDLKIRDREIVVFETEMIEVKGGSFIMGTKPDPKNNIDSTELEHKVTVSDFRIGKYEVTYEHWKYITGELPKNIAYFYNPKNKLKHAYQPDTCSLCPITSVTYWEVKEFIEALNNKFPNKKFRLPTEAEWEYAAKGGWQQKDSNIKEYNAKSSYSKVGKIGVSGNINSLGLSDMNSNVFEWCSDWYDPDFYSNSPEKDPIGPKKGAKKILRGGCSYQKERCKITYRGNLDPNSASSEVGLRLVMEVN